MVIPENIYIQVTYRHSSCTSIFSNMYTCKYMYTTNIIEEVSHEFEDYRKSVWKDLEDEKERERLYYNLKSNNTEFLIYAFLWKLLTYTPTCFSLYVSCIHMNIYTHIHIS